MADSINLVLHLIAGLSFIMLIYWLVRLQKRSKLHKLLMQVLLGQSRAPKISGDFRSLLSQICDALDIDFQCDTQMRKSCVMGVETWVTELTENQINGIVLTFAENKLVLKFKGNTRINTENLLGAIKFLKKTELQVEFI